MVQREAVMLWLPVEWLSSHVVEADGELVDVRPVVVEEARSRSLAAVSRVGSLLGRGLDGRLLVGTEPLLMPRPTRVREDHIITPSTIPYHYTKTSSYLV